MAPKVIIGLGNPGHTYNKTRHNIGFMVIDKLAEKYYANWLSKDNLEFANININNKSILLIKTLAFMNNSGSVIPFLLKKNFTPEDILIIHDELEKPFGKINIKLGGSAKGHNGLKSFIEKWGDNFWRLRFGISRPSEKSDVASYVLGKFTEPSEQLNRLIDEAIREIEKLYE